MTPRFAGLVGNRSQMCNGRVAGPKRPLLGEVSGIDALLRSFSVWTTLQLSRTRCPLLWSSSTDRRGTQDRPHLESLYLPFFRPNFSHPPVPIC